MAPPDNFDPYLHEQMGRLLAGMEAVNKSIERLEEGARRSEDKATDSRAVVHRRMDELVNRVAGVEQVVAVVKEDVSEMKPVTEDVRHLEEDAEKLKAAVKDMKPVTDDIKRWRLMGIGGLTVIGIGGMALGVSFADAMKRIASVLIGRL
ncbi:hypothetical protein AGRO_2646 [Agrobacterium sp. ATCC 31749]|uniref:DUF1515 family protein n=1 Tax=unclassified Agrobacterium TaxID=2632611 RepID=UPI00020DBCB8|nr:MULTISPECIES: DUF1515 family protein [unclassified Agrobacterium]EGL64437.1 hypothetical protein AGRO_2646 [Agrobacterium sp. ATCC 31749]QKW95813.1 DUF1515 domain-containing protein [Agrobacterium sp. CGMCC 11546]